MPRELMLLRHGKSDWNLPLSDFERPLKDRGKRGAQRMGVWLRQQDRIPDLVVSSPAERARITAQKLLKAMGGDARRIIEDRRIYAAQRGELLQVLAEQSQQARRVLLVGHNPSLEDLTEYLADKPALRPSDGKLLPTASIAIFKLPDQWRDLKAGMGQLLSITRATALPKKFPFPDHNGQEQRDRPAYYYRQSSVIPYRRNREKIEIMVVRSSKRKHWVVPKGVSDPAISPRASAAKEAFEEAGVEGDVGETALGSYQYEKWGAMCTVQVYPMRVTHVLDEAHWQEHHRGREWLSPQQAMMRVKQRELQAMIDALVKYYESKY
jgi:phosphohistidine phosphatase